jgi:hypothetical protein
VSQGRLRSCCRRWAARSTLSSSTGLAMTRYEVPTLPMTAHLRMVHRVLALISAAHAHDHRMPLAIVALYTHALTQRNFSYSSAQLLVQQPTLYRHALQGRGSRCPAAPSPAYPHAHTRSVQQGPHTLPRSDIRTGRFVYRPCHVRGHLVAGRPPPRPDVGSGERGVHGGALGGPPHRAGHPRALQADGPTVGHIRPGFALHTQAASRFGHIRPGLATVSVAFRAWRKPRAATSGATRAPACRPVAV